MPLFGKLNVGDMVYRSLSQEPYEVVAIEDMRVQIKRGLEQKWVKNTSMTYSYTKVGTPPDIRMREDFKRHGYKIWGE